MCGRDDKRPQISQPRLPQRSGVGSVTQSTRRKAEVFVVRTRPGRRGRDEDERERYDARSKARERRVVGDGEGKVGRNPGRRRRRRRKERDEEHKEKERELKVDGRRGRHGERQEGDESNSSSRNPTQGERCKAGLKKREGEVEQEEGTASKRQDENRVPVPKTDSYQSYLSAARFPDEGVDKDQRESGRRKERKMDSWKEEAIHVQSDKSNIGLRKPVKPRNRAKREKQELQGIQYTESDVHVTGGQENSNAEGIGTQVARSDRNWRVESEYREPGILCSAEKEKLAPDQERKGEREGKRRSKKCGHPMPKKASHLNGNTMYVYLKLSILEPVYRDGQLRTANICMKLPPPPPLSLSLPFPPFSLSISSLSLFSLPLSLPQSSQSLPPYNPVN